MDTLVQSLETVQPFFEKLSRNKYLRAVKDGFLVTMPVVLFSSLFILVSNVPNIFGFYWSDTIADLLNKPYDYSMGVLGLLVSGTTAKALTSSFNRDLPATNKINDTSTWLASSVGFLLLSVDSIEGGFATDFLGTEGLIAAFISAFVTVNVYNFFVSRDIKISMPDEVPPNIAQAFADLFPFAVTILIAFGIDTGIREFMGVNFAQAVIELFQPLFSATDSYLGLSTIAGSISFFWFIGIHGPSIVSPPITPVSYQNLDANLKLFQSGQQATYSLTPSFESFITQTGGTGATFVVPLMFMFMAKSKRNKAVGRASFIPTMFTVNEPILFGAPLILNPVFFIPFILAPMVNTWLFKFFVDVLKMNGFIYLLPWTTPAPLGLIMGTGFDKMSFILAPLILMVDALIYYPFFKIYDQQILEEEMENIGSIEEKDDELEIEDLAMGTSENKETNVLVLCAGGGTSGLLSNSLNKAAEQFDVALHSVAGTYGEHQDMLSNFNVVVLAPQVSSNYEDMKKDADNVGAEVLTTSGEQYISLTNNPEGAMKFVLNALNKNKENGKD